MVPLEATERLLLVELVEVLQMEVLFLQVSGPVEQGGPQPAVPEFKVIFLEEVAVEDMFGKL